VKHTQAQKEKSNSGESSGDGLQQCSNDAFRKEIDAHRCQSTLEEAHE
jgi:hypothetical protein